MLQPNEAVEKAYLKNSCLVMSAATVTDLILLSQVIKAAPRAGMDGSLLVVVSIRLPHGRSSRCYAPN
jgi:hypothetical protein